MATTAIHGRNTKVFVNEFDFSRALKTFNAGRVAEELDCTTFGADAKEFLTTGVDDGTLSLEGYHESDPVDLDKLTDEFQDVMENQTVSTITVCPEGASAIGKRALLQRAVETRTQIESPAQQLVMAMADFRGDIAHGVVVAAHSAFTADGNGSSHDGSASSANGGVGHLHVTAVSGTSPTGVFKIQHSADNSTFVDLITFTAATAVTSQRVEVTGTVERYLRVVRASFGGTSPSLTAAVAFARF